MNNNIENQIINNIANINLDEIKQFINCTFEECDLNNRELKDLIFYSCMMENCNFSSSEINNCSFIKTNLNKSDFSNCFINNCNFENCNLSNADFTGEEKAINNQIYITNFTDCKMIGVNFYGTTKMKINFKNCILYLAYLDKFDFKKKKLEGLNFTDADIRNCNFEESILEDCFLTNVNFRGDNNFESADLRYCDISGVMPEKIIGAIVSKDQASSLLTKYKINVL